MEEVWGNLIDASPCSYGELDTEIVANYQLVPNAKT